MCLSPDGSEFDVCRSHRPGWVRFRGRMDLMKGGTNLRWNRRLLDHKPLVIKFLHVHWLSHRRNAVANR